VRLALFGGDHEPDNPFRSSAHADAIRFETRRWQKCILAGRKSERICQKQVDPEAARAIARGAHKNHPLSVDRDIIDQIDVDQGTYAEKLPDGAVDAMDV
jgi:hypothetical protein